MERGRQRSRARACEVLKQLCTAREENWQFLMKLNIHLPCDPAVPLLGFYPREKKTYFHTKMYIRMFAATLFLVVPNWKHPKYSSTGGWINRLRYTHATGDGSALKQSTLSLKAAPYLTFTHIMLGEKTM